MDNPNQSRRPNRDGPMADNATWLSWELWRQSGQQSTNLGPLADAIVADPQAHIDALVEAGVLEACSVAWTISSPNSVGQMQGPGYRLGPPKPPHEHDWRLKGGCSWDGLRKRWAVGCVTEGCEARFWTELIDKDDMSAHPKFIGEVPADVG